jgi:serine/threonine protein kinase
MALPAHFTLQLPQALKYASDSTGMPVVVKALRSGSEELSILRFLHSVGSPQNHTIELLNTFNVDITTFIVLPRAERLDFMSLSLRELAEELSTQFLEGVAFLHHNGVAHLDLKPQNVLVEDNRRLVIIDFDISVRVNSPEDTIDRFLGTQGWMAPEIGDRHCARRSYSPIRADLWSCGRMLEFFGQQNPALAGKVSYQAFIRRLLLSDPKLRPLLPYPYTSIPAPRNALKRQRMTRDTYVQPLVS